MSFAAIAPQTIRAKHSARTGKAWGDNPYLDIPSPKINV